MTHKQEKVKSMNINPDQIRQLIGDVKFPVGKSNLVQMAQQKGANDQVIGVLQRLPDKTFNSLQDIQNALSGLGNIGNIKLP
jgi:hypothetical protein